jgi:hypothetical protein
MDNIIKIQNAKVSSEGACLPVDRDPPSEEKFFEN